jgi:hypothetical protein
MAWEKEIEGFIGWSFALGGVYGIYNMKKG